MKLSIITPTMRLAARLELTARTLASSSWLCPQVEMEWIIVDELLWGPEAEVRRDEVARDTKICPFEVQHVAPKPSRWRGPGRDAKLTDRDLPDSNGPRNCGIALSSGNYLAFLDDCTAVGKHWLPTIRKVAEMGAASRYTYKPIAAVPLGPDGFPELPLPGDVLPYECEWRAMKGNTGAYPADVIHQLGGFDESYGGSYGFVEVELAVRAHRLGCKFMASRGGLVVWEAPHANQHADPEIMSGNLNQARFDALVADGGRTEPEGPQPSLSEIRGSYLEALREEDTAPIERRRPFPNGSDPEAA